MNTTPHSGNGWHHRLLRALAILIALAALSWSPERTYATTISSTVSEDNRATTNGTDQNQNLYDSPLNHPAVVTAGSGYDFSSSYASLTSINQITLTLTMFDGNSGTDTSDPSNFDFSHLHFYVGGTDNPQTGVYTGGIDTGIVLNGFRAADVDTQTFSIQINPATTGAAILSTLQSGSGFLPAYVVSDNSSDTALAPNEVALANDLNNATTTLTLSSVPEPATSALIGTGLLLTLSWHLRRLRYLA